MSHFLKIERGSKNQYNTSDISMKQKAKKKGFSNIFKRC